jgi:hypothetical protein
MNRTNDPRPAHDDVPAGNCPPRSKSIALIAAVAWTAWFVFLVLMMVHRMTHAIR